jgi:hypothetical protein
MWGRHAGPIRGVQTMNPYAKPPRGIHLHEDYRPRTATQQLADGATADALVATGFSVRELAAARLDAATLVGQGFTPQQLAITRRYSTSQLRGVGATVFELLGAGYPMPEVVHAGYSEHEFAAAGVRPIGLAALGFGREEDDAPASARATSRRRDRQRRPHTAPASRATRRGEPAPDSAGIPAAG